ncbi:hypothetical protein AJ79_06648 [Helicocarpus griseus UAMH5409]|uniref:25S rRNA (uridine-N(3))-methyltransferase BMT5-like domain-containing protein n=1 Tax=Helicocarpus griseus UAMH5409 TaxID=1447875 RepID=A0A2B7XAP3_9EURO|nr:hypothetical protein AJ79_06648 [Helicocarpus griseus UAMH5409]
MGKSKKPRIPNYHHADRPKPKPSTDSVAGGPKKMKSFSRVSTTLSKGGKGKASEQANANAKGKKSANGNAQTRAPTIPFQRGDRVLLVGEGDFSFALSLATHHGCKNLLATSYDSEQTLYEKYPQAKGHIGELCSSDSSAKSKSLKRKRDESFKGEEDENENGADQESEESEGEPKRDSDQKGETQDSRNQNQNQNQVPKVLFSIDARKLGSGPAGGGKAIRNGFPRPSPPSSSRNKGRQHSNNNPTRHDQQTSKSTGGPWDIICFNFPHVGGLSTDVNRQVRANQELLVSFFKACVPLLSEPVEHSQEDNSPDYTDDEEWPSDFNSDDDNDDNGQTPEKSAQQSKPIQPRTTPGQILTTLFEGEPYTLWNIRDLARHAGLRVVTSFRFPWSSYPGYAHARTLGEVERKDGGSGRGGWRGEEREARMYVFEKVGARSGTGRTGGNGVGNAGKKRKKRKGGESSDESD